MSQCIPRSDASVFNSTWLALLTRDRWIPVSREFEPHQCPRCFLEQETLLSLLSTGWFQERIRA